MRLTATDKAIGEINMRKADIERARALVASGLDLGAEMALLDRCIEVLRSTSGTVAPKKQPKADKPKAAKRSKAEDAA